MRHFATTLVLLTVAFTHSLRAADDYVPGPDSKPQEGVPKGVVTKYSWTDSKIFPGTVRDYWVYVPAQYTTDKPACIFVCQDNVMYSAPTVFDNLIHKKEMPVTIGIFIQPGMFPTPASATPGIDDPAQKKAKGKAGGRSNRSVEYDSLGDKYARFLLEEILPEVSKQYNLTKDPEGRCIAGNSSGAICAWTVAWERPDEFRKVFSSIGSFTNIRGGHVYPSLIRKTEKKPIRIFLQDGSGDLDNASGNWPLANQQMAAALKYQKYDYRFEFGDGGHTTKHSTMLFPDAMRWMWRDFKP
ncbi:MAG: esterase family protein [Opitutaceae bacterium]|nr:esterase family protein [Verrucomicrobiales bacterium]